MIGGRRSFFRSRWVEVPEGVEELDRSELAPGFRAGGAACGLKGGGETDVGVLGCEAAEVRSALLLTRNAAAAAPIRVCRDECDAGSIRAVVVNSGNANAATGERGYADALAMRDAAAAAIGAEPRSVAVAETGVIGVPLRIDDVVRGIADAAAALSERGGEVFASSIMTTDSAPKACTVRAGGVTVSAQAKGAGMMEPGFATMLCFVQTDAQIPEAETALRAAVAGSFERITVDGQMSTNDTVLMQATGAAGATLPAGVLEAVLQQLALEIVADGEGASRVARVAVSEAATAAEAERVARAIANSPLVKTALYGRDPNWGRIAQAAGMALAGRAARRARPRPDRRRRARGRPGRSRDRGATEPRRGLGACVLLRPHPRVHPGQRRVHDMTTGPVDSASRPGSSGSVETLLEALPYIREFHGRTVVIKYGGAAMADEALRDGFATDVVLLKYVGLNPVIVHGGGPDITSYMERLGMEVRFVEGVRVSDPATVEVAKMVLLGKVNSDIVMRLGRHGQPAVGLSGEDGALFEIRPHANADEIGFVGEIERVSVDVLNHIAEDYIPVIASVGVDRDGNSYNVNADTAAGKVAAALAAHKAIFLTDVAGWLADPDDEASLNSRATVDEVEAALDSLAGGMRPKLGACAEAIRGGVGSAHIIDGRRPHSLLLELFTDAGIGTMVVP